MVYEAAATATAVFSDPYPIVFAGDANSGGPGGPPGPLGLAIVIRIPTHVLLDLHYI